MSSKVKYKGSVIAELNTNTSKTLKTSGTYCEADIVVENTQDGGITPSGTKEITDNGTYDVTEYASANVNVPKGITPSGQIEITENGTFDVTNYASALVDVQGGGGKSFLLREDNFTVATTPSVVQDSTGNKSAIITSSNFSAETIDGKPYVPIAPEGTNYCTIECTYIARNVARDFFGGKGIGRDMYNKLAELYVPSDISKMVAWTLRVHQACGGFWSNGSAYNIQGHNLVASTSEWSAMFGTSAKVEGIFGAYNASAILGINSTQSGGIYINDDGNLVYICSKRSSGNTELPCFKVGCSYKIRWFYFDNPPVTGFFQEPYDE